MTRKHKRILDEIVLVLGSFVIAGVFILALIGALALVGRFG